MGRRDQNLWLMLRHEVFVERPEVAIEDGDPAAARYVREPERRRALVQPLSGELEHGLAGVTPESTVVVYMEEGVEAGTVIVVEGARYEVVAAEDEGGQGHHWRMVGRLV